MTKLLVIEMKGKTYRLLDIDSKDIYRVFQRDFDSVDFIVGSLFEVSNMKTSGTLIMSFDVVNETLGDSTKPRVELCIDEYKIGDLVDGVPILNFGKKYAKAGKKVAYAYFR